MEIYCLAGVYLTRKRWRWGQHSDLSLGAALLKVFLIRLFIVQRVIFQHGFTTCHSDSGNQLLGFPVFLGNLGDLVWKRIWAVSMLTPMSLCPSGQPGPASWGHSQLDPRPWQSPWCLDCHWWSGAFSGAHKKLYLMWMPMLYYESDIQIPEESSIFYFYTLDNNEMYLAFSQS